MWATSLAASVRERLPGLRLAGGTVELLCGDHMCMRFGEVCLCKLSIQLARLQHVRHLDLSGNGLERLPEVWQLKQLEALDVSSNKLGAPLASSHFAPGLHKPHANARPLCPAAVKLPEELSSMPHLRELNVAGNPLRFVPPALEPLIARSGQAPPAG